MDGVLVTKIFPIINVPLRTFMLKLRYEENISKFKYVPVITPHSPFNGSDPG
jgi:hypothetical protein